MGSLISPPSGTRLSWARRPGGRREPAGEPALGGPRRRLRREGRASGTAASSSAPFRWSSPSRPAGSVSPRSLPAVPGGSLALSLTTRRKRCRQQLPRTSPVGLACTTVRAGAGGRACASSSVGGESACSDPGTWGGQRSSGGEGWRAGGDPGRASHPSPQQCLCRPRPGARARSWGHSAWALPARHRGWCGGWAASLSRLRLAPGLLLATLPLPGRSCPYHRESLL